MSRERGGGGGGREGAGSSAASADAAAAADDEGGPPTLPAEELDRGMPAASASAAISSRYSPGGKFVRALAGPRQARAATS